MKRTRIRSRPADNHRSREWWEQQFYLLGVRSGLLCEARTPACLAPGGQLEGMPREQVSVQHRRAQGAGGTSLENTHSLANQLIICGTGVTGCHGWIETQERDAARTLGLWIPHSYRDGEPVPPQEYWLRLRSGRRVYLDPGSPVYLPHPDPYGLGVPDEEIK